MVIKEIEDQKTWNEFLLSQPTQAGIFLQSWEWLEFQKALGRKVWRLGIMEHEAHRMEHLIGVCGLAKYELPMGNSYLYALRGPVLDDHGAHRMEHIAWDNLIRHVRTLANQEQAIFWRIEPRTNPDVTRYMLHATRPIQPEQTIVSDLSPSEDEMLLAMHKKTRYNIRLALRKGVELRTMNYELRTFEQFWNMFQKTAKRDGFKTHERKYYETLLKVFSDGTWNMEHGTMGVRLHIAYSGVTPIAGAIVGYFGDTATYLFGASSYEHRAYMGPYGLHWTIMQEAKKMGYRFYDFWGTDTKGAASAHGRDWSGITRFKMGFNGKLIEYPGTFDLPRNRFWYTLYRLGRKMF